MRREEVEGEFGWDALRLRRLVCQGVVSEFHFHFGRLEQSHGRASQQVAEAITPPQTPLSTADFYVNPPSLPGRIEEHWGMEQIKIMAQRR